MITIFESMAFISRQTYIHSFFQSKSYLDRIYYNRLMIYKTD